MHRRAVCCVSGCCGAEGDGCNALLALLMEAAAAAASAQPRVVARAAVTNPFAGRSSPLLQCRKSSLGPMSRRWRWWIRCAAALLFKAAAAAASGELLPSPARFHRDAGASSLHFLTLLQNHWLLDLAAACR